MRSTSGRPRASPTRMRSLHCPPISSSLSPTRSGGSAVTLDEMLASLFPDGHDVRNDHSVLLGSGPLRTGGRALVIGIANRPPAAAAEPIPLPSYVLTSIHNAT